MQPHNKKHSLLQYVIAGFVSVLGWNLLLIAWFHFFTPRPPTKTWIAIVMYVIMTGALTMLGGVLGLALGAIDRRRPRPPLWMKSVLGFVLYDLAWWPLNGELRLIDREVDLALAAAAGLAFALLVERQGARA